MIISTSNFYNKQFNSSNITKEEQKMIYSSIKRVGRIIEDQKVQSLIKKMQLRVNVNERFDLILIVIPEKEKCIIKKIKFK